MGRLNLGVVGLPAFLLALIGSVALAQSGRAADRAACTGVSQGRRAAQARCQARPRRATRRTARRPARPATRRPAKTAARKRPAARRGTPAAASRRNKRAWLRVQLPSRLRKLMANFKPRGWASLARGKRPAKGRLAPQTRGLGELVPITTVIAGLKSEQSSGKSLPGDDWVRQYEKWKEAKARGEKVPSTPPGELAGDDKKKFDESYVKILIPDLREYVPFIADVVFSQADLKPKDLQEKVVLLYQYGCRRISRLMPGFARIVQKRISATGSIDLVQDWNAPISDEALQRLPGAGSKKGAAAKRSSGTTKAPPYKPKTEIVEICTVTHRQLEETLKKDLGLIAQATGAGRARKEPIEPLSGPVMAYLSGRTGSGATTGQAARRTTTRRRAPVRRAPVRRAPVRRAPVRRAPVRRTRGRKGRRSQWLPRGRRAAFAPCFRNRRTTRRPAARTATATIRVISADYGRNCRARAGNYTSHVARACNNRSTCRYKVTFAPNRNRDPAPRCSKAFAVRYQCGRSAKTASIRQEALNKTAVLSCAAAAPRRAAPRPPARRAPARPTGKKKCKGFKCVGQALNRFVKSGKPIPNRPGVITVVKASLGHNCNTKNHNNLTSKVAAACNGKVECSYKVPKINTHCREGVAFGCSCTRGFAAWYSCGVGPQKETPYVPGNAWDKPPAKLSCRGAVAQQAAVTRTRKGNVTIEQDINRSGNDYRNTTSRTAQMCRDTCALEDRCAAFTWVSGNKKCYLKSSIPTPQRAPGMVSGVRIGIVVTEATYGDNCKRLGRFDPAQSLRHIKGKCDGRLDCDYKITLDAFGGRDVQHKGIMGTHGCTRAYVVKYHCGDPSSPEPTVTVNGEAQGRTATLRCREKRQQAVATAIDLADAWKNAPARERRGLYARKVHQILFKDLGDYPAFKQLKGETFHDIAKRLLNFYRKSGSARNFQLAVAQSKDKVQSLANDVKKNAPTTGAKAEMGEQGKPEAVNTRTRRELLRRKVEQWTYGYEYNELKDVVQEKGRGRLLGEYKNAEKEVVSDFWNDCEELRALCEAPNSAAERKGCERCAVEALFNHCVSGKGKGGICRDHTTFQIIDIANAVNGLNLTDKWNEKTTSLSTRLSPNGNTFLNWVGLALVREANDPLLIRAYWGLDRKRLEERAVRHLVRRRFLAKEVDEQKGLSNEGKQLLDALPISAWQRCTIWNPAYREGGRQCDGKGAEAKTTGGWHNARLFKEVLKGRAVGQALNKVVTFWKKRCGQHRGHCDRNKNHARDADKKANELFGNSKDKGGVDRDKGLRDAGDSISNTLGPIVGKLLGLLLKAAGMYDTVKTLGRAAGLTPEQSADCEDPEYRKETMKLKGDQDNKRGCLLKVFAKNFTNVLESIIIMLGNKLVDWGVDLLRTVLQPVKSALLAAAGSVPFAGGVLATIVDIGWELIMNFGAKMLLKGFVIAKLPEWLQIRKLASLPYEKLIENPVIAVILGIITQLIEAAVQYGDKSLASVGAATVITGIQEALLRVEPKPYFWIRALIYAKRELAKENIETEDVGAAALEIGKKLLAGFGEAMARRLDGEARTSFQTAMRELLDTLSGAAGQRLLNSLSSDPIGTLTKLIAKKIGPIVIPIVTSFVSMPQWAKGMINKFGVNLSKTVDELTASPPRVDGAKIVGRVVDVLKPAGRALLDELRIDADIKTVLLSAYDGLTGALGEDKIGRLKQDYLDKPWEVVKGVVGITRSFIQSKIGALIQDPALAPEKDLLVAAIGKVLDVLADERIRNRIFGSGFNVTELLKELADPLQAYASGRLAKLTAGTGLEGLVMLLVEEVFGTEGPFRKGAAYFTAANLQRRLATAGPRIAGQALDAVAGIVTEKGVGGPILGSLVTGVTAALRKALSEPQRLTSAAGVLGLVKDAFGPLVDQLVTELSPAGSSTSPFASLLRGVFRGVLDVFANPANLTQFAQRGPQILAGLARSVGAGVRDAVKSMLGQIVPDAALKPVTDTAIDSIFQMLSNPEQLARATGEQVLTMVKNIGQALFRYVAGKASSALGTGQPAAVKTAVQGFFNGVVTELGQLVGSPQKMRELVSGGAAGVVALVARLVRAPLGSLVDAVVPPAARAAVKAAATELIGVIGDPHKLRELGVMRPAALFAKLAPAAEALLTGILQQAVPAAEFAPIRAALGKLRAGLANPGAATDDIRNAIGQVISGAVMRIGDQRLRSLASSLVSLAQDLVHSGGASLRASVSQILGRVAQGATRFVSDLLPAGPVRELVGALVESVGGLFGHSGGIQQALVGAAHEVLPRITGAVSRLLGDVLRRVITDNTVANLVTGLVGEVLGFIGQPDRWRSLSEQGIGYLFSRLIPIGRDFAVSMLGRIPGSAGQILRNVVRSLFQFAGGMFSGGAEAIRNFARNAVSAMISMGVGALRPVVVGFVRQASRSQPLADFLDSVLGELSTVLSNPAQLQTFLGRTAPQAFTALLGKAKDLVKRLIGGVIRDQGLKTLAEEGLDAVIEFAQKAITQGGRNLGEAAKGILVKVLPAFVGFAKTKLVQLIPTSLGPLKRLAGKWFDRLATLVRDLVRDPAALGRRLTTGGGGGQILGEAIVDAVEIVKEPLAKIIGWAPLRDLISNLLTQVGELLKDPAALVTAFRRGGEPAMRLLLPKLEKVIGPFAEAVMVTPISAGLGKDVVKGILDAARGLLKDPSKLFRYLDARDPKGIVKCIIDDFKPRLLAPLPDALKGLLGAGIDTLVAEVLKGARCPAAR